MEEINSNQRKSSILTIKRWYVAYFIMIIGLIGAIFVFTNILFYYYENYDQSSIAANRQAIFFHLFGTPSIVLGLGAFIGGIVAKEQFIKAAIAILFTIFAIIFGIFLLFLVIANTESPEFFEGDISLFLIFVILSAMLSCVLSLIIGVVVAIPGFLGSFLISKFSGASEDLKLRRELPGFSQSETVGGFHEASVKFEDQTVFSTPPSDDDIDYQPITYNIDRKLFRFGFSVEYLFSTENGELLMIAKDRFNPHWWKFNFPVWVSFFLLIPLMFFLSFFSFFLSFLFGSVYFASFIQILIFFLIVPSVIVLVMASSFLDLTSCSLYNSNNTQLGKILSKKYTGFNKRELQYTLQDSENNSIATFTFLRDMHVFNRITIETPLKTYNGGAKVETVALSQYKGYYKTTEFTITDPRKREKVTVTWMDYLSNSKSGKKYQVKSQSTIDTFLIFALSIRLISSTLDRFVHYDHTPSSGCDCGCD